MSPIKTPTNVGFVLKSENIFFDATDLRKDVFHTTYHEKDIPLADIYTPNLRKYEKTCSGLGFDHLDIVTTWRAISVKQGYELMFWRSAFERALDNQLLLYRLQGQNLSNQKKQSCEFKGSKVPQSISHRL